MEITADQLTSAFTKIYASYTLDEQDIKSSVELRNDGRFTNAFFKDLFFEGNGAKLPFFYNLMWSTKGRAGTNLEGYAEGSTAGTDAYQFSQAFNSQQVYLFKPSPAVEASVKRIYGDRANYALQRVKALFSHIEQIQQQKGDPAQLDPRLRYPFYLQDGRPVTWYSSNMAISDQQRSNDFKYLIEDFIRRTNNFYGTREKVDAK